MPLYEYRCRPCGHQFEALVRKDQTPVCPQCRQEHVEKLMSAAASHVSAAPALPIAPQACPPSDAPPCSPHCCRM